MVTLGEWLHREPFALAMSSGFFAFYAHTGMLESLIAHGAAPALVAGSSAGALVAGAWGAGLDPGALAAELARLDRGAFWDPAVGAGLLAGRKFDALLRAMLPVAAIDACRVPVRISAFDILARRTEVLARGDLADAIRASCAVPAMFHPVWIQRRPYWDGGILDRPGLAGVPPGRVLYHHIASRSPWRPVLDLVSREDEGARRSRWGSLVDTVAPARDTGVPRREGMVTLVIEDLPRSGPFRLDAGRRALAMAREAMARALDRPIVDGVVRV